MSSFEFVMVIVSIILGLGITTLLRGTVNVLRAGSEMTPGLLHGLWVALLLLFHVGLWSIRWNAEPRTEWPFGVLLVFLFAPITLYALAELVFPPPGRPVDLTEHFLDNRRSFFGLLTLTSLATIFGPFVFYGGPAEIFPGAGSPGYWAGQLALVLLWAFLAFSRNKRVHLGAAAIALIVFLWLLVTTQSID